MVINAHTKIGALIKQQPQALEAIIRISPAFEKLRNPILRKLMAGRTSIAMAAKIGGCTVEDFYKQLQPLGFSIGNGKEEKEVRKTLPLFLQSVKKEQLKSLDVRADIAAGNDPLQRILKEIQMLPDGYVLKIINTFEPAPLMQLLAKKGFESYADEVAPQLVETYFYRKLKETFEKPEIADSNDWESVLQQYNQNLQTIDVRHLPMPQPMHTILEALEHLPTGAALLVYHKRIPVFLLPELAERGFDIRTNTVSDSEVHLLIFRK